MDFFIPMIYRKHNKTSPCRIPAMQFSNLDKSNSKGRSWANNLNLSAGRQPDQWAAAWQISNKLETGRLKNLITDNYEKRIFMCDKNRQIVKLWC